MLNEAELALDHNTCEVEVKGPAVAPPTASCPIGTLGGSRLNVSRQRRDRRDRRQSFLVERYVPNSLSQCVK